MFTEAKKEETNTNKLHRKFLKEKSFQGQKVPVAPLGKSGLWGTQYRVSQEKELDTDPSCISLTPQFQATMVVNILLDLSQEGPRCLVREGQGPGGGPVTLIPLISPALTLPIQC